MSINWDKLEEEFNNFKPQAPEGKYKVKVDKIEVKQLPSGSIPVTFKFENSKEYSFPWGTHWVSTNNVGWTQWHHKQLLQVLGINEDNAKKAIDNLYSKENLTDEVLIKGFQAIYDKVAAKHPEVEIVVRPQLDQNGEYRYSQKGYQQFESEFTDPRVFSAQQTTKVDGVHAEKVEEAPAGEVDEEIDLEEIPF